MAVALHVGAVGADEVPLRRVDPDAAELAHLGLRLVKAGPQDGPDLMTNNDNN